MNALQHGGYSKRDHISAGSLAEDRAEMQEVAGRIRAAMPRRNGLEHEVADVIAAGLLRLRRVRRYEQDLLDAIDRKYACMSESNPYFRDHQQLRRNELAISAGLETTEQFHAWLLDQQQCSDCENSPVPSGEPSDVDSAEQFARLLREHMPRKLWIKDLWTVDRQPRTPGDWERALKVLMNNYFSSEDSDPLGWAHALYQVLQLEHDRLARERDELVHKLSTRHANEALAVVDRIQQVESRISGPLNRNLRAVQLARDITEVEITPADTP